MDQISFTALLVGAAVTLLTHWLWQRRNIYKFAYDLPNTLWGLPLFGILLSIGHPDKLLHFIQNQWKMQKERTFCGFLSTQPFLFTSNPEVVRQICTQSAFNEKSKIFYDPLKTLLKGGGMIGARAQIALHHRKLLSGAFRPKQLLGFMNTFNTKGREFVNQLSKKSQSDGEAHGLLDQLRMNAILTTFDTTLGSIDVYSEFRGEEWSLQKHFKWAIKYTFWETIFNCINLKWLIHYNPYFHSIVRRLYCIVAKFLSMYTKALHTRQSNGVYQLGKKLVIDQIYQHVLTGDIKENEIPGEISEIVVATYETTALTVFSTMVLLAMYPDIQERVFEEIVSIFPDKNVNVEFQDLSQLTYMDMVINESMRLFPAGPLIAREVNQDTPLEIDNKWCKLPKNFNICIDIFGLHRNPNIWGPNADKFDPDNFLPQNVANRNSYAFIPFSKGPRTCFGYAYANIILKVMLVHILRNYRLSTTYKYEDIKVQMNIFLVYGEEPQVNLSHRL